MFSGIVEEAGEVVRVTEGSEGLRLAVSSLICGADAQVGDSIAVSGCCLTAVQVNKQVKKRETGAILEFDLLRETWNRTNLRSVQAGSVVNLERSLPANGRIHGHFVSGHIDDTGAIDLFEQRGADWFLRVNATAELLRYIVFKGSIALDGISLTVAEATSKNFSVWIIPHTYAVTALHARKTGDLLNIETDILAKYVRNLVSPAG